MDPKMSVDDIEIEVMDGNEADDEQDHDYDPNAGPPQAKRFRDQIQETDDLDLVQTGLVVPAPPIFFYPLTKPQRRHGCKIMQIPFFEERDPNPTKRCGRGKRISQPDVEPDITVLGSAPGDGHCYFHSISYLLNGSHNNHQTIRRVICEYIADVNNWEKMKSYILTFPSGEQYLKAKRMRIAGWGTEVEIYATAQILGHDVISYSSYGKWNRYVGSGNSVDTTKYCLYISNESQNHFDPVTRM
jgi:hypothetical protein